MIQVCEPPRTRQVRRLSAEEFCRLAQSEVSSVYRPRSEVLRMLTVGEAWGVYSTRGVPGAGCILLPMDADVAAAAALRRFLGWNRTSGGYFLTPAAGPDGHAAETLAPLLAAAAARQEFLARQRARWAVVECAAEELIPLYLRQGFALRAIRPLAVWHRVFCCRPGALRRMCRRYGSRWPTGCTLPSCWLEAMPRWKAAKARRAPCWHCIPYDVKVRKLK